MFMKKRYIEARRIIRSYFLPDFDEMRQKIMSIIFQEGPAAIGQILSL